MNKAVELMMAWGNFDAKHPKGTLEDFCRDYLIHKTEEKGNTWQSTKWPTPVSLDFALMRMTGRVAKLHTIYSTSAIEGTGINSSDEFSLLNAIQCLDEPRKTEAIYTALFELSTGTDMMNRLKKIGFISEYDDKEDRRSKRIKITPKGQKALGACRKQMGQLAELEYKDLTNEEKKICLQLLGRIDEKFSNLWLSHKGKSFEEIYSEIMGRAENTI
jgi:DNA-binding MarR family transcriptional regulator